MDNLDRIVSELLSAPSAAQPAQRTAREGQALALSDDALRAVLRATGGSPPQRGPAESHAVAVPSDASEYLDSLMADPN